MRKRVDKLIIYAHVGTHGSCVRSNGLLTANPITCSWHWASVRAVRLYISACVSHSMLYVCTLTPCAEGR